MTPHLDDPGGHRLFVQQPPGARQHRGFKTFGVELDQRHPLARVHQAVEGAHRNADGPGHGAAGHYVIHGVEVGCELGGTGLGPGRLCVDLHVLNLVERNVLPKSPGRDRMRLECDDPTGARPRRCQQALLRRDA